MGRIHIVNTADYPTEADARTNIGLDGDSDHDDDVPYLGVWRMSHVDTTTSHIFSDITPAELEQLGWIPAKGVTDA